MITGAVSWAHTQYWVDMATRSCKSVQAMVALTGKSISLCLNWSSGGKKLSSENFYCLGQDLVHFRTLIKTKKSRHVPHVMSTLTSNGQKDLLGQNPTKLKWSIMQLEQ